MDPYMDREHPTADYWGPWSRGEREPPNESDQMQPLKEQLAEASASINVLD